MLNMREASVVAITRDLVSEQTFSTPVSPSGSARPGRFEQLPSWFHVELLGYLLVYDDIIHAISRLDPKHVPTTLPIDANGYTSLYHRFHVGRSEVSIAHALRPERVLAPLGVCKLWNVIGCAVFYGRNTFAFSSLGE